MAKTSMKIKQQRKPKFSTQAYTRCKICGRPHSVLRNTEFAVFASVNWHTRARSPELRRHLGKSEKIF